MMRWLLPAVVFLVSLAACAGPTAVSGPAGCPSPDAGTTLLVEADGGYCLLHPDDYEVERPSPGEVVIFEGSLLDVENPRAYLTVEDAAPADASALADQVVRDLTGGMPGIEVQRRDVTLGGAPAVVLDNLPGQDINRQVLTVRDGRAYRLMFVPADPATGDVFRRMEELYDTVTGSFAFTPAR